MRTTAGKRLPEALAFRSIKKRHGKIFTMQRVRKIGLLLRRLCGYRKALLQAIHAIPRRGNPVPTSPLLQLRRRSAHDPRSDQGRKSRREALAISATRRLRIIQFPGFVTSSFGSASCGIAQDARKKGRVMTAPCANWWRRCHSVKNLKVHSLFVILTRRRWGRATNALNNNSMHAFADVVFTGGIILLVGRSAYLTSYDWETSTFRDLPIRVYQLG